MSLLNETPVWLSGTFKVSLVVWNGHFCSSNCLGPLWLVVTDPVFRPVSACHLENFWILSQHSRGNANSQLEKPFAIYCDFFQFAYKAKTLNCIFFQGLLPWYHVLKSYLHSLSFSEMESLVLLNTFKMLACFHCYFPYLISPHFWFPLSCCLPTEQSVLLQFVTLAVSEGHQDLSLFWKTKQQHNTATMSTANAWRTSPSGSQLMPWSMRCDNFGINGMTGYSLSLC